jgi:hypothetical protein
MSVARAACGLVLAVLAGCGGERVAARSGLEISWSSADSLIGKGEWRGHAEAGWCEAEHRLTVFAARADTGAALLVVLPSLAPRDSFPLVPATDTSTAERATLALRWPDDRALLALASRGGRLRLIQVRPTLAATFEGTLAPLDSESELPPPSVRGRIDGVTVATGEAGCRLAGVGPPPRPGVP